jgi:cleavage and polyadenylation specificity factor subunit 1
MECFAELLPPTAVTHAIALPFLSPNANNVVIAKTSLLQVFDIKPSPATDDASGEQQTARLVLVGEYPLSGTVTALARVKILDTKTGGEAILLSFAHAKLSLLEWDPDNHRTSTISIHFYEGDNIVDQPFGPGLSECDTILTADPSSRCAALKFGPRFLAIVPFRQAGDELIGEEEEGADANAITKTSIAQTNGGLDVAETPYKPSFVLPMTTLDPSLNCIVHLAFLHEYREPTFGILASSTLPSAALLAERKDILTYTVFTLDLEQRASTNLITVTKLPSSLWKVMPLPAPIGGALLIGDNEIIHIDQSGKANATAVNEFAKLESDFGMADQSHLNMKLEGCVVEVIDHMSGGLLIVLRDGSMATLSFKVLRRSISELVVTRLASEMSGAISRASPSCLTLLRDGTIFVGSDFGPSSLVSCYATTVPSSRKRSLAQMNEKADEAVNREGSEADEEEAEEEEDDDDLYSVAPATKKRATSSNVHSNIPDIANFTFAPLDNLPSLAPVNQVCLGRAKGSRAGRLELLAGTGRGHSSRLAILNRDIIPEALGTTSIGSASAAWTVCAKPEKHADQAEQKSIDRAFDNLLFVNDDSTTRILDINDSDDNESQFVERSAPEFENEGETLEVSTLRNGTRIVQCRKNDIRIYESNLALSQIIPMEDEESGAELNIVHTSTCEPYLLVVLDDGSMQVHQVQGKEVEPLTCHGVTEEKKWLSGSIYSGSLTRDDPVLLLLSSNGSLHMFSLPDLEPIGTVLSLPHLPPVFSMESSQRRMGAKETLTELLMADLGADGHSQPYLVLRTAMDDIVLYEPFNDRKLAASSPWYADLRFRKVPMVYIPKYNEAADDDLELKPPALRGVNIGQYQAICIPGTPPSLILRSASSSPKVLEIRSTDEHGHVQRISSLNTPRCQQGFLTVDSGGTLKEFRLPEGAWFSSGWSVRQLDLGGELRHLAYHTSREVYVVATSRDVDFYFSEDDNRHPEQDGKYMIFFHIPRTTESSHNASRQASRSPLSIQE